MGSFAVIQDFEIWEMPFWCVNFWAGKILDAGGKSDPTSLTEVCAPTCANLKNKDLDNHKIRLMRSHIDQ
jgi:hypothetical protein